MKIFLSTVTFLALTCLAPSALAEPGDGPHKQLIAAKAPTLVSIKFVLQITFEMGGTQREQERNASTRGVVVDACGLVMVRASAFEARARPPGRGRGRGGRGGRNFNVTATPTNIRVVFPGSEKEHPAIMGAKDSKFGLAFVLIDGLDEGKKLATVDMSKTAPPRIGQTLYGVTRLDQGFDHAPFCDSVRVLGKVTKPHTMWVISGRGQFVGMPLYTADGAVAGASAIQRGVGEGSSSRPFLLPLDDVRKVVADAKTASIKSLEELQKADAADDDGEGAGDGGDESSGEGGDDK